MKSTAFFHNSRLRLCAGRCVLAPRVLHRHSSTETAPHADLKASLQADLTSRPANEIYEYLNNTNSHLLNLALADFLPPSCYPPGFSTSDLRLPRTKPSQLWDTSKMHPPLALGHHLVYFSPQVLNSDLLPDGTDSLHSPGLPFVRRLWAGGSLSFNRNVKFQLHTRNMAALCKEEISKVWTKGQKGEERVFLTVRRRIGGFGKAYKPSQSEGEPHIDWGPLGSNSDQWGLTSKMGKLAVVETKNLVFMREKSLADARRDAQMLASTAMKVIKPAHLPDFIVSLVPTQALLFRWSALTFNAHRIHLDPQYCREIEGHRNLLVHGPLTLVLMLSVLRSQLKEGEMVLEFEYRNLVPLYAEEEMKICVRRDREKKGRFDVWIEGLGGGYAVKASAIIGKDYSLDTKSLKDTPGGGWLKGRGRRDTREEPREDEAPAMTSENP